MAGLKDAYKKKSPEGYKDVFKEQARKSGDYTSTPIEALRKPNKKTVNKLRPFSEILKNIKYENNRDENVFENDKISSVPSRRIKVVYTLKVKWKIWTVCFCFIYIIFLIYGEIGRAHV